MNIRALRYFVDVVQLNGFSRAADNLFITQSAISRSIKNLEDELGVTLLVREINGVKLTDDGTILFEYAKNIITEFNNMNKALKDKSGPLKGTLNVGLPPVIASTYFADIIMAFSALHPQVELKIFELGTNQIEEAMREGKVETAAVMLPFNSENVELTPFAEDKLVLLISKNHSLATKKEISFPLLLTQPFIFFAENFRINDLVNSACGIYNTKPIIAGRSNHLDLVIAMVKAGVGITLLPESIYDKNPIDDLAIVSVIDPVLSYRLALANNKNNYQSLSCREWNKLAMEKLMTK